MTEGVARIAEAVSQYLTAPNQDFLLNEIVAYDSVERANERLLCLTGIRSFFPNYPALEEFRRVLTVPAVSTASSKGREWGDFQTPPGLASQVCQYLSGAGISPRVIIEPTFGAGNFIIAALSAFPQADLIYGVEIQEKYEWHLKLALLAEGVRGKRHRAEIELHQADIFTYRFPDEVLRADDILVVGNAPWVTNAELGAIGAGNLPIKANFKGLNGLDAVTGKGNFDIGEFVLLRMLDLFSKRRGTLAMLCKNSVIKNIVEIMSRRRFNVSSIRAYKIDAKREFGASVDASLLVMEMGAPGSALSCRVSTLDQPDRWERTFGWTDGKFVADLEEYQQVSELDGQSPVVWRQGLKHDCARIMEVDEVEGTLVNGNGEKVDVEDQWVYPFFKSSDLRGFEAERARKRVIITQRYVGDDTSGLQFCAPRLWSYLVGNRKYLDARKSRIYQGRPRFSIFGIGEYSFKPFKVAISGLYKKPTFSMVLPINGQTVLLDDTCYFLGFDTYLECLLTATVLNSPPVRRFLGSVVFTDAKRPYTKEVLMRVDLIQAARLLSFSALADVWASVGYVPKMEVLARDFDEYRERLLLSGKARDVIQYSLF